MSYIIKRCIVDGLTGARQFFPVDEAGLTVASVRSPRIAVFRCKASAQIFALKKGIRSPLVELRELR